MIKIKHKQTKQVKSIPVYEWDGNNYNHETWTIISENNLVLLYQWHPNEKIWIKRHRMEKTDAIKFVTDNPNNYKYEALPPVGNIKDRVLLRNESQSRPGLVDPPTEILPAKTPIMYAIKITKAIANSCLSILKRDYIKLTIIGIVILVIWFFIYPILKTCFGHP